MNNIRSSIIEFDITKKTASVIQADKITTDLHDTSKVLWIHCDLNDEMFFHDISKKLQLPENISEMLNDGSTIPRLDEAEESLTLKIQVPLELTPLFTKPNKSEKYTTLIMHLTHHYCLTIAPEKIPAIEELKLNYEKATRYAKTPCFIVFLLMDNILNDYAQTLFAYETLADELDIHIKSSHKNHYRKIMRIKKESIKTKRFTSAIRDILMRISGRKINVVSENCRISLIDLYNHSQSIVSEADSIREILNGMLDQIDNAIMHKMSETMKVLTAYATIFMPQTLITGIYGMNFRYMPELDWQYGYFVALAVILGSGLLLFLFFKKMKWF